MDQSWALLENDLPPKSVAQSERGIQNWRQKLSANERKAAAILESAELVDESPGDVSAKASITGRGCVVELLLTEDIVT